MQKLQSLLGMHNITDAMLHAGLMSHSFMFVSCAGNYIVNYSLLFKD